MGALHYRLVVSTVGILTAAGGEKVNPSAPETGENASKGAGVERGAPGTSPGPAPRADPGLVAARGLAVAAVLGPCLLALSELTTLFTITAQSARLPGGEVRGGSNHLYAMLVIALVAAPMAWGAVVEQARPAMLALAALGLLAVGIALAKDLPVASGPGTLKRPGGVYVTTQATPGIGFYLETLGAALLLVAGGGALVLAPGRTGEEAVPGP